MLAQDEQKYVLEAAVARYDCGDMLAADEAFSACKAFCSGESDNFSGYLILIEILRWKRMKSSEAWKETRIAENLKKLLEDIFSDKDMILCVTPVRADRMLCYLCVEDLRFNNEQLTEGLRKLEQIVSIKLPFLTAIYPYMDTEEQFTSMYRLLLHGAELNQKRKNGVFLVTCEINDRSIQKDPVAEAIVFMQTNIDRSLSRREVAEHVHLNENYFSRLFHEKTGLSFCKYLEKMKIKEAQKLLRRTQYSVGEISGMVGYVNFSHFSQVFFRVAGMRPTEYRRLSKKRETNTQLHLVMR